MTRTYGVLDALGKTGNIISKSGNNRTTSHTGYTTYDSIVVPEGSYLILAQMTPRTTGVPDSYRAQISLEKDGVQWKGATSRAVNGLTTTALGILTDGGTITMKGYTNYTSDIAADWYLSAIKLGGGYCVAVFSRLSAIFMNWGWQHEQIVQHIKATYRERATEVDRLLGWSRHLGLHKPKQSVHMPVRRLHSDVLQLPVRIVCSTVRCETIRGGAVFGTRNGESAREQRRQLQSEQRREILRATRKSVLHCGIFPVGIATPERGCCA